MMRGAVMYERLDLRLEFDYLSRRRSFEALGALTRSVYGPDPRSTHLDAEMWRAFPRGYVGCWIDRELRGCIHIWPLDGRRAGDFLIGARPEAELTPEDFATVCNAGATVWYFSGLLIEPAWRNRGMGAHLLAEAMVRWHRDLPFRLPTRFLALATSPEALGFIRGFGMERVRPDSEMADGDPLYGRTFRTEAELFEVVRAARAAADRKGRLVTAP
ncbi:MAG: GNAT family N-acetyltransferase [Gemmatimonadota bacterium]|jgi:GNAT superfamily N-acetyltransferase